jgi:hypothetical protein
MEQKRRERLEYHLGKALQWFGVVACLGWFLFILLFHSS